MLSISNAVKRTQLLSLTRPVGRTKVHSYATKTEGYSLNISKCVDKAHEGKSLHDIVKLPPGALQGLRAGKADDMLKAFNITSIGDLGKWKHYQAARAIAVLASTEEAGKRPAGAMSNINGILDQSWETASLNDILVAPPSALQGLAPWTDDALKDLGIKSVKDLAAWKYAAWADALVTLAQFEREDFGSR